MTRKEQIKYHEQLQKVLDTVLKYDNDLKKYGKKKNTINSYKQGVLKGFDFGHDFSKLLKLTSEKTDEDIAFEKRLFEDDKQRKMLVALKAEGKKNDKIKR